jgi:hypothetical protein
MELGSVPDPLFLSKHLASCIEEVDSWNEEATPEGDRTYVESIRRAASSLEGLKLSSHPPRALPHQTEEWYWTKTGDEFYSREVVSNLPGMVERFSRLRPVIIGRLPDKEVNIYLREATRCFVYGFFQASIALSRAALEAGLNRHLERKLGDLSRLELHEKITKAFQFKFISGKAESMGQEVRKAANEVLHLRPATEGLAFDSLASVRGVLKELYKG